MPACLREFWPFRPRIQGLFHQQMKMHNAADGPMGAGATNFCHQGFFHFVFCAFVSVHLLSWYLTRSARLGAQMGYLPLCAQYHHSLTSLQHRRMTVGWIWYHTPKGQLKGRSRSDISQPLIHIISGGEWMRFQVRSGHCTLCQFLWSWRGFSQDGKWLASSNFRPTTTWCWWLRYV